MGVSVEWRPPAREAPPGEAGWRLLGDLRDPRTVARSRTTVTERGTLLLPSGALPVHRKTYLYPRWSARLAGAFRTTLAAPSRGRRELGALDALRALGLAPEPVALGERRVLGFLAECRLVVRTAEGALPLTEAEATPGLAAAAGGAAGRIHAAGLERLSLAPRNLLAVPGPGGAWTLLKVDSGRIRRGAGGGRERARDLADLVAGLEPLWPEGLRALLVEAYAAAAGGPPPGWEEALPAARAALRRRAPRGPRNGRR